MSPDCKRNFRLKTRAIYLRLIRKFGYINIVNLVPKSDEILLKRLRNIKKAESRKKRSQNADDDSDDGDDIETSSFVSRSTAKR